MTTLALKSRRRLLVAAGVSPLVIVLAALSPPVRAAESGCPAAASQNGPVFGKRFTRLASAAGIAALTGRKASARAAADAAVRDTADTARENATVQAAASACNDASGPARDADAGAARGGGSATAYSRPGELPISEEIKAQKQAFDEFGKVHCSDCEGGYAYESWAKLYFYNDIYQDRNGWANKLAKMEPGDEIHWQGHENYGTIAMRTQEQVGGFDCKTYRWTLERGASSAHRDGLICWGKASQFSENDSWVEVY